MVKRTRRRLSLVSVLLAAAAVQQAAAGIFGGRISVLPRWGSTRVVVETAASLSPRNSLELRGGSTAAAVDEDEGPEEFEQLYLPGLLAASIVRSKEVRSSFFLFRVSGGSRRLTLYLTYSSSPSIVRLSTAFPPFYSLQRQAPTAK
jgi:hypothetical protein